MITAAATWQEPPPGFEDPPPSETEDAEAQLEDEAAPVRAATRISQALDPDERTALAELEIIIDRGLASFVEVGNALLEISDRRLYRATHGTFKGYVADKWQMTAARAYQLCDAAEVIKSLPPGKSTIVDTESQARELARVAPEHRVEVLETALAQSINRGEKLTAAQIREVASEKEIKLASSAIRMEKTAERMAERALCVDEAAKLPDAKFRVIYADPPWKYGDQLTEDYGPTKFHYPSMSIAELCAMPIKDISEPDSVLFLWVTSPFLFECQPVIEAWGFEYKTSIVWWKQAHNMGHYVSNQHEFLLICTRGSCTPDSKTLLPSVLVVKRGKHSEKPHEAREMIETLYPHGKRIELFARKQLPGWASFGNQIGGDV